MQKIYRLCYRCMGNGSVNLGSGVVENPCNDCKGAGKVESNEEFGYDEFDDATLNVLNGIVATQAAQQIIIDDSYDKIKKIKKTVDDIWEKVNV